MDILFLFVGMGIGLLGAILFFQLKIRNQKTDFELKKRAMEQAFSQ